MNAWRLFRWVLVRGVVSGAILGALFGMTVSSIYSLMLPACLIGLLAGFQFGAFLGAVTGIVNGVALVVLTRLCFTPPRSLLLYRFSAMLLSILCTAAASYMWINVVLISRIELMLPIMLIATVAAAFFGWRLPGAAARSTHVRRAPANAVLFYIEK